MLFLGELLVDQTLRSRTIPVPGVPSGHGTWAVTGRLLPRSGCSARRPGSRPSRYARSAATRLLGSISQALEREGIVDAGPRIAEDDNRYRLHVAVEDGRRVDVSTNNPLPENATRTWAQAIAAPMSPSDVLYIDGALLAHEPCLPALSEAVRWLLSTRVVFDASPTRAL